MSEGVIKFERDWTREPIKVDPGLLDLLNRWRSELFALGLIGALPDGVGFGNISVRTAEPGRERGRGVGRTGDAPSDDHLSFFITGSGTGGLAHLDPENLSLVTSFDLGRNTLSCRGLAEASSESLSHGAIYSAQRDVCATIHIHSNDLWNRLYGRVLTTPAAIEYGTPEMAISLKNLSSRLTPGRAHTVVMGGHPDGLISFGEDLNQVGEEILQRVASAQE